VERNANKKFPPIKSKKAIVKTAENKIPKKTKNEPIIASPSVSSSSSAYSSASDESFNSQEMEESFNEIDV
jgi:hypothetical protein